MHSLQCHKCIVVNKNTWKIKHNILFPSIWIQVAVVVTESCPTLCNCMDSGTPGLLALHYCLGLLKLMSIKSAMPSNHLVLFRTLLNLIPSFPASGSFPMSHLFTSGGQSTGASASSSVLQRKIQGWFPLGLTFLICLWSKGLTTIFSRTVVQKHQFFGAQPSLWSSSHTGTWLLGKPYVWLHRICWQSDVSAF